MSDAYDFVQERHRATLAKFFAHRHYEALAKVLGQTRPGFVDQPVPPASDKFAQWELMVKEITKMLVLDSSDFNIARFMKAVHKAANK